MKSTAIETKTFSDLGSLIECLEEIRDERNDGSELAVWANGKLLTKLEFMVDRDTNEWIELR